MLRLLCNGLLVCLHIMLTACISQFSPAERRQHADIMATSAGWHKLRLPTARFILIAYAPKTRSQTQTLTVYIEGDGLAWASSSTPSDDPTPWTPLALELALKHNQGPAAYLARPCQYVQGNDQQNCEQLYWTNARFAPEVIIATDQAITQLKRQFNADKLVLVGYSGGGAIAALVVAKRNDVIQLITVAGNLDHQVWTKMHEMLPLSGSLNAADSWQYLINIPQLHLVGGNDENVPLAVAESYRKRFPDDKRPAVKVINGFDHHCCWVQQWPALIKKNGGFLSETR